MMHGGICGRCCPVHKVAFTLVMIGAINWGLVGLGMFFNANWNLVNIIFGAWPKVEWVVYIVVGLSALMMLMKGKCKQCIEAGETCCKEMGGGEKMMGEKSM